MTAKTGERAQGPETSTAPAGREGPVTKGDNIPSCPCRRNEFNSRTGSPATKHLSSTHTGEREDRHGK